MATKKIFFVEDDPVIVEIYRKKFLQEGFQVEVAEDGLVAIKMLAGSRPDLIVLDLMMPKFSGADVLKFVRSQPALTSVPVIILSNSYMTDDAHQAAVVGADKALLKSRCTPKLLVTVANDIFSGRESVLEKSVLLAASEIQSTGKVVAPDAIAPVTAVNSSKTPVQEVSATVAEPVSHNYESKVLDDFLTRAPEALTTMRRLSDDFSNCKDPNAQPLRLEDLHRKVHFLTSFAGLAGCHQIAQLSSALEVLLLELRDRPKLIHASTLQTIGQAIDFFHELLKYARRANVEPTERARVLVVDDDLLSNRLVVAALNRANFNATSVNNPLAAMTILQERQFDLILLDVTMPPMNGFEFCRKLRSLMRYQKTPVIFVTCLTDFESHQESIRSGGNDIIAKPILPLELAVKAVTHVLRSQLPDESK